ncbi:MAG: ParB N-terminal domain-containing protein [Pirellulales bacterium]
MDNGSFELVPFKSRRYEAVPIAKIKVINTRNRDQDQFDMNVDSINQVGLLKPVRVNDKFLERTGLYELICGEGRLLAHQRLGHDTIQAEVVTCTRKEAYLQSLVENIARTKPGSMDFARELKRLNDEGWSNAQLARITCKNEHYIRDYIRLVEQGEERLIHGVEQGIFPIKFAVQVATSTDAQMQNVLMDAFDEGLVTTNNFAQARKLIAARAKASKSKTPTTYTVNQLKHDIQETTKAKTSYVREAKTKENRFMTLLNGINTLWRDQEFLDLLRQEKLSDRPELAGDFRYES